MIPFEIKSILREAEFEQNGGIQINSVSWINPDTLRLTLYIDTGSPEQDTLVWTIDCLGVRRERIELYWTDDIHLETDHPLLWPFILDQATLYFTDLDTTHATILGQLYLAQQSLTRGFFPLDRFLNDYFLRDNSEPMTHGQLAEGPMPVLETFRDVLIQHGAKTNIVNRRRPQRWTGSVYESESSSLEILLMGDSFVVAEGFWWEAVHETH